VLFALAVTVSVQLVGLYLVRHAHRGAIGHAALTAIASPPHGRSVR
jgi:hypothetical protein